MTVGIDAIQFDVPKIYLPIETLAIERNIEPAKLEKGLGLQQMSFLDVHQDVVTLAANAVYKLIKQENVDLATVSRIYVGTESAIDNSKPIATYIIQLLEQEFGPRALKHCDALDMTFACIGGVDALQNCLDYVRLHPNKKAIVVTTDNAKYDLNSTGEYTQGAGAIAMLITSNPKIVAFNQTTGVATEGVFDFFKPKQSIAKEAIVGDNENKEWFGVLETEISITKEQPVFDGHYSNECYTNRITEAYNHFKQQTNTTEKVYKNWDLIVMHLPYCFQGRRTFIDIFAEENSELVHNQIGETQKDKIKMLSKSSEYVELVSKKIVPAEIASGKIGNIYTGSIFLAFLSALYYSATQNTTLLHNKVGFIAYGSGSKSKVFEGNLVPNWQNYILKTQLFEVLENRTPIRFKTYEKLHKKELKTPVLEPKNEFVLDYIEKEKTVLKGARYYKRK